MPKRKKLGDWTCPDCGGHNYLSQSICRCGGKRGGVLPGSYRGVHNWTCPKCGDHVFGRNSECRLCGTQRPDFEILNTGLAEKTSKAGDWYCPGCGGVQLAKNTVCKVCGERRPDEEVYNEVDDDAARKKRPQARREPRRAPLLKPGDWYCPSCGDMQFAGNTECRQCGGDRPAHCRIVS